MQKDKQAPKELKVTDKRIFTADGDIREEFKQEIKPSEPPAPTAAAPAPEAASAPGAASVPEGAPRQAAASQPPPTRPVEERRQHAETPPAGEERRRSVADKAENPGTPFTNFIEQLIVQGYMFLGMLRDPRMPQVKVDPASARQMIDILSLLRDKTQGNLSAEESDFLETHLGELRLAFVQRTKSI